MGPRSGGGEDEGAKIKLKVALIIGTKLASWLTIMVVMVFYHFTGEIVPNGWFEVTAIVVVPANSLANPIFNSEITRSVRSWCKKRFCPFPAKDPKGHVIELQLVDNINNPGKEESPKGKQE